MKKFVLLALVCFSPQFIFAQGTLTPPGAPAPTMKSLDQIEARTAITNATGLVTISQPGSYYLTRNIAVTSGNAINIMTNGVTLDLNGFTISSTASPNGGNGIYLALPDGNRDITISNGHITGGVTNNGSNVYGGPGFSQGIYFSVSTPHNIHVANVTVSGCSSAGISVGANNSSVLDSCAAVTIGGNGLNADTVTHCSATDCGNLGIAASVVSDSHGIATGFGIGISANMTVNNSSGQSDGGNGIYTLTANNCYCYTLTGTALIAVNANNCYVQSSGSGTAISAGAGVVTSCYAYSTSGIGISARIANSCVIGHGTTNITYKYNMP